MRALILMLILLTACQQTKPQVVHQFIEVDSIYRRFLSEARARGINIDNEDPPVFKFGKLPPGKNASCKPNSFPREIVIDSLAWKFTPRLYREFTVFHELAHCVMDRRHSNEVLQLNECRSWLRETDSLCCINIANSRWREYYLDQLFDPGIEVPDWYNTNQRLVPFKEMTSFQPALRRYRQIALDSIVGLRDRWTIEVTLPRVDRGLECFALSINELSVAFCYERSAQNESQARYLITLNSLSPLFGMNNVLVNEIHMASVEPERIFIQMVNEVIYIYFGEDLKSILPLSNGVVRARVYSTFEPVECALLIYTADES